MDPLVLLRIALPAVIVALLMEPWSRFVHRVVWHGPLWSVHESHHRDGTARVEANDLFVLLHALATAPMFVAHALFKPAWWVDPILGVAIGMSLFGVSYFIVHDGLAHGRLPVGFLWKVPLLRRIAGAHRAHHKGGAAPYGLFLGPQELRAEGRLRRAAVSER